MAEDSGRYGFSDLTLGLSTTLEDLLGWINTTSHPLVTNFVCGSDMHPTS